MKKFVSCLLSIAMVFSLSCTAFAASAEEVVSTGVSGLREATEEEMSVAAQQALKIEDEEFQTMLESAAKTRVGWISAPLTYYGQEKSTSCGPASVRMSLKTLTGTTYSESTIRTGTGWSETSGTSINNLVSYMNSKQSITTYQAVYGASESLMMSCLYYGVYDLSLPIIGVKESTTYGFPFNLSAHAIVSYGVYSDLSKVMIADPWAGYVNNSSNRTYQISSSDLYTGYSAINAGLCY